MDKVRETVRGFILEEFLPGEDPEALADSTPLITGAIIDSLATLKLVAFLEERFGIEIQAYEAGVDHLNTVSSIVDLVRSKM